MAVVTLQMIFDRAWKNHVQDKTPRNDSPEFGWRSCGDALPAFHPARAEKGLGAIDIQAKYADVIYENALYAQLLSDQIDLAIGEFGLRDLASHWDLAIPGTERHMQQDRLVAHSIELVVNMQKMYQASPPEIFDALATVLTCMLSGEQSPDRNLQEQCCALMHALDSMRHKFRETYTALPKLKVIDGGGVAADSFAVKGLVQLHWQNVANAEQTEFVEQGGMFDCYHDMQEWLKEAVHRRGAECPDGWQPMVCDSSSKYFQDDQFKRLLAECNLIAAPKKYKLLCDVQSMEPRPTKSEAFLRLKAGEFVWASGVPDYGIASMDSRILGTRCLAVSLQDDGMGEFASVQAQYLEFVE